jgi:ribulose 1,5-bisphosphate synthetase/thiazole synthase
METVFHEGNLKERFAIEKIPQNVDAILIGSGISALTTAALLAKKGNKR